LLHPSTRLTYIDDTTGFGVIATELIPQGTIVWVLDELDQKFSPDRQIELTSLYGEILDKYTYYNNAGDRILCWDHARYINHSCRATCLSPGFAELEVAVRDIHPGQQVTDDYGSLNLEFDFECACGEPECRRTIRGDEFEGLAPVWDALLRDALRRFDHVDQPLMPWVQAVDLVKTASADPEHMASIMSHRCAGPIGPLSTKYGAAEQRSGNGR
jgi:uncharacterized protein